MPKVKHTKNELKKQKDDLKRFTRYLPTLMLKKRQLQLEILRLIRELDNVEAEMASFQKSINSWVDLFAEDVGIGDLVSVDKIHTSVGNIAGTDIPVFEKIDFKEAEYDLVKTPLWVDYGVEAVKNFSTLKTRYEILKKQLELIREELRITTQRVSLFEKVKIPEAKENIRRIRIFLGDLQTASVVTGKIAKRKIAVKTGAKVAV